MQPLVMLFMGIFFSIYGLVNYYIGSRTYQILSGLNSSLNSKIYWMLFWFIALSYIGTRLLERFLPNGLLRIMSKVGSYWMGALFYLILVFVSIDFLRLILKLIGIQPISATHTRLATWIGAVVLISVTGLLIYGTWNAKNDHIQRYDMTINKQAGVLDKLRVVMVSDIHLGRLINNGSLTSLVNNINQLNPDVVLLAGDIIDESIEPFVEEEMAKTFKKIKSKYGVFGVLGNHELYSNNIDEIVHHIEEGGIKVLRDEYIKVADSFYIVGRDDIAIERIAKKPRKKIDDILADIDNSLPIILMDHNPKHIKEANENNIDLQVSGHTHRGQFFPNNFITSAIFEIDWGHLQRDDFNVVVSSGFGTWGPPIRIGNRSEIVDIHINFNK